MASSFFFSSFAWSCSSGTVAPNNVAVRMEMFVSAPTGDPEHPVTVRTRVINEGRRAFTYELGCVNQTITRLTDPEARHVNTLCGNCPNVACPACAPMARTLRPGESYEESYLFAGELRDCDGAFPGASGEYRADAEFTANGANGSQTTVSKSVKFTWTTEP